MNALYQSDLHSLSLQYRGKVRDVYRIDEHRLLIVATDRLSAFDVVMDQPVPGKGRILTRLSNFWFDRMIDVVPNHLLDIDPGSVVDAGERDQVAGRAVVVRALRALPVEAIVRGYLIGSGWRDYQKTGEVCGIHLPAGLRQGEALPEPLYTPSTKADNGAHDENIDFEMTVDLLGRDLAEAVRTTSLEIYRRAADFARRRGIIIADTKLEFGLDAAGRLILIDELLTPDSSRFWPVSEYRIGISPPSYDKQFVRDYLETLDWDKRPPPPPLPEEVVRQTAARYQEAERRLTGQMESG